MNFWNMYEILFGNIFTLLLVCSSQLQAAPKGKGKAHLALEQAMLHKLHKPWFKPDKPSQQPRKGERPCGTGACKEKLGCSDCQHAVPLDVNWEKIKP